LPPFRMTLVLAVAALFADWARDGGTGRRWGLAWACLVLVGASARLIGFHPYRSDQREEVYRRAVEALRLSSTDVVAAPEIGAIGYFTRARVLDTAGLISPAVLPYYDDAWRSRTKGGLRGGDVPPRLLADLQPDYVISLSFVLDPLRREDPAALSGFEKIASYEAPVFGSRELEVWKRIGPRP
jgi:hypothetical protein